MARSVEASPPLARVDALHTALTHLVLDGGDLQQIAAEAAALAGLEVAFTSVDGRERASALTDEARGALEAAALLDGPDRIRVERIKESGAPVGGGEVRALRVAAGGTDLARMVCLRLDSPLGKEDVRAAERVCIVAALVLTRQVAISAVERKYQGDFLRDLLVRGATRGAAVDEQAQAFGWDLDRPAIVLVAELDPQPAAEPRASREERRAWHERFVAAWRQATEALGEGIACVDLGSEVVALLPAPAVPEPAGQSASMAGAHQLRVDQLVVPRVVDVVSRDKAGGRRGFSVGLGRVAPDQAALPGAYAQALRALQIGRQMRGGGATTYFDQLGLHRLIALVPDRRELRAFAREVLGPLADGSTEAANLRETLQVLLDTNFNMAEAARLQFFHYNTVRYRVTKLERLLGRLSSDPRLRLEVAVALRILESAP